MRGWACLWLVAAFFAVADCETWECPRRCHLAVDGCQVEPEQEAFDYCMRTCEDTLPQAEEHGCVDELQGSLDSICADALAQYATSDFLDKCMP